MNTAANNHCPFACTPAAQRRSRLIAAAIFAFFVLASLRAAHAQTETVLYSFSCCQSQTPVVLDKGGNIYGTYQVGGNGGVFKLTPSGVYSTLYAFGDAPDGSWPSGLVMDQQGNLYGTTYFGGSADGFGIIFKISSSGTETILHNFDCSLEGCFPQAGLFMDGQGNLFGTTTYGGSLGYGTVFEFVPSSNTTTALYNFTNGSDGCNPWEVVLGNDGDLYGTTQGGCSDLNSVGSVYKLTLSGTFTLLHSFSRNGKDGFEPEAGVVLDSNGNVYGTTAWGGKVGVGTVFKITPTGKETILHSFSGDPDGILPQGRLIFDSQGNLFGTTGGGGDFDSGVVFKLAKTKLTILHSFAANGVDGVTPIAGVTFDANGNLYGTTLDGGPIPACGQYGCGTVFKIAPQVLVKTIPAEVGN